MSGPRPVLIVDDDQESRGALAEQLSLTQKFQVSEAGTIAEVECKLLAQIERCDALLLEVSLPDGDGGELCMKLRKLGLRMPVIMLSGAEAEVDIVRGLDAGANDYIVKPFRMLELLARLRAHLRIFDNSEDAVFTVGPYRFQPSAKLLLEAEHNRKIRLTEKETAILKFLYRADGRPVVRRTLLNEVWRYNAGVTTHTLETHIYRLRQKLERDPALPTVLLTEQGGYRLNFTPRR